MSDMLVLYHTEHGCRGLRLFPPTEDGKMRMADVAQVGDKVMRVPDSTVAEPPALFAEVDRRLALGDCITL